MVDRLDSIIAKLGVTPEQTRQWEKEYEESPEGIAHAEMMSALGLGCARTMDEIVLKAMRGRVDGGVK